MLPDKMAISHSSHLFVPVAFVFCLLLPLIRASDSHDYTDSRQFEKNPAVSRHRNTIQRLPNYNWKPPDKYNGSRKELIEKNLRIKFTKPEDSEERMADPWIKKMQEISGQEREKWVAHRRNVKFTFDNTEETTKAGKLTNDESITIPMLSKSEEYYEDTEERSKLPVKFFEESELLKANVEFDPTTSKPLVRHLSVDQENPDVKDDSSGNRLHDSSWSNSNEDINIDKTSSEKFKSNEWNTDVKNSSEKFVQKAPVTTIHRRHKDYEISDVKGDPFFKRNASTDYEKSELEEERPSSIINSHSEESNSRQFKNSHIHKNSMSAHKNFTKFSENDKKFNHINDSKKYVKKHSRQFNSSKVNKKKSSNDTKRDEDKTANSLMQKGKKNDNVNSYPKQSVSQQSKTPHIPKSPTNKNLEKFPETSEHFNHKTDSKLSVKKHPRQFSLSQNDNEKNNEDSEKDNEKTTAKSLMWKSKKEKDDAGGKDVTEKLNHKRSFHSSRWGMSVTSPPTEFLKDMSRRSKHRKNKERTEKEGKHHLLGRWGMSVTLPPREFFEDISMPRGTKRFTIRTGPRSNEVRGSSNNRSPIHQSRRNLQTALVPQLMTDERYKKLAGTLVRKVPNSLYNSRYPSPNYWNNYPTNAGHNNDLFFRFLQALRSYVWQDDMDIPMSCRIRIPYTSPCFSFTCIYCC